MSGFAAIAHLDGRPIDEGIVRQMAARLAIHDPDDCAFWTGGWSRNVALVHAKFATTDEAERESQPTTVDGTVWVAGDIRVDAREELWPILEGRGAQEARRSGDAALVLHAYAAWGPACVEHLLGDFSFAAWDERDRRLFCARDHMGVRPFYFHQAGGLVVCSNRLECVLAHPDVPDAINEEALLEFLLFGENTTFGPRSSRGFAGCPRRTGSSSAAPDGHRAVLDVSDRGAGLLPERHRVRRPPQIVIDVAVRDRLRTPKVAVFMSGGLDSSTLAALASRRFPDPAGHVLAHTIVVEGPEPDAEPQFVDQIARHLGIPVHYRLKGAAFYDSQWQRETWPVRSRTGSSSATTKPCSITASSRRGRGSRIGEKGRTTR